MTNALVRSFEGLATRIDVVGARSVGFTGALVGEGASTLALGTALALATQQPEKVLLVDANWIQPSLTIDARLADVPGLADHLAGGATLESVIRPASAAGFAFLPLGSRSAARPTLRSLATFLASETSFQTVLVDLPPVLAGEAYVLPWATLLDRCFLVLREAATPLPVVRLALDKIAMATPQIVLNRTAARTADLPQPLLAAADRV